MAEPTAIGMVLAMLVNPQGKAVAGGSVRGHLYASADELVVLRPNPRDELRDRATVVLLLASFAVAIANLFLWRRMEVLWGAVAAQIPYWLTRSARKRRLEPMPLDAAALEAAKREGRAGVSIPAGAITALTPPESRPSGFRKPARFVLPDGALEIYLADASFGDVRRALGRE